MKHLFIIVATALTVLCSYASATDWINNADEITEEWLTDSEINPGYTEHIRHFKRAFNNIKVRGFLEFGVGFSTKYFMDNCNHVISVEFVTPGSGPEWLKYCMDLFRNCNNWVPVAYFAGTGLDTSWAPYKYMGAESVYKAASYQPVYYKSYASIDSSFIDDLNTFVKLQTTYKDIDMAFVDAGVCIRGDLVQVLFNKVPIIVAHDIAPKANRHLDDVYGYGRMVIPDNYEEIHVPFGMGTAFWIKKESKYQELAKDMQDYVNGAN